MCATADEEKLSRRENLKRFSHKSLNRFAFCISHVIFMYVVFILPFISFLLFVVVVIFGLDLFFVCMCHLPIAVRCVVLRDYCRCTSTKHNATNEVNLNAIRRLKINLNLMHLRSRCKVIRYWLSLMREWDDVIRRHTLITRYTYHHNFAPIILGTYSRLLCSRSHNEYACIKEYQ